MIKKIYSITLSLAGIFQSVYLVQQLADSGKCDNKAFVICLESILDISPNSVIKIYGNQEKNLNIGLELLISILKISRFSYSYIELIKYIFYIMRIEGKLAENEKSLFLLKKNILIISEEYYIHRNIDFLNSSVARLYLEIISSLGSRIVIKGKKIFLQDFQIQEKIRCLLFSGIRSVVLWKQLGGNQLQLIFLRYYIIQTAQKILCDII